MRTIIFAVLALTLLGGPTRADDDLTEAKAAFAAGKAAYEKGDYATALSQFQRANLLAPAPSLSYNIGRTYENMGRYHDAVLAFKRYLELVGEPQNDDDRKFQADLKTKIAGLQGKPDLPTPPAPQTTAPPPPGAQPPAPQPYPPVYYNPYGSPYGYGSPALSRDFRLKKAQGQRKRAIALIVVGSVLTVAGIAVLADGVANPHGCEFDPTACYDAVNWTEDFIGASLGIVGITLWAPGAASYVKSAREIRDLSQPEPKQGTVGLQTFLFHSPVFRF